MTSIIVLILLMQTATPPMPEPSTVHRGDIVSGPPPGAPPITPLTPDQTARVRTAFDAMNAAAPPPIDRIRAELLDREQRSGRAGGGCVPTAITFESPASATAVPLIAQGVHQGALRNGWKVSAMREGCTDPQPPVVYSVMWTRDDRIIGTRLSTGDTLANHSIIRDAWRMVLPMLVVQLGENGQTCAATSIGPDEMRIVEPTNGLGDEIHGIRLSGSWSEEWDFIGCGKRATVPITFQWDGAGGAHINTRSIRVVPN